MNCYGLCCWFFCWLFCCFFCCYFDCCFVVVVLTAAAADGYPSPGLFWWSPGSRVALVVEPLVLSLLLSLLLVSFEGRSLLNVRVSSWSGLQPSTIAIIFWSLYVCARWAGSPSCWGRCWEYNHRVPSHPPILLALLLPRCRPRSGRQPERPHLVVMGRCTWLLLFSSYSCTVAREETYLLDQSA